MMKFIDKFDFNHHNIEPASTKAFNTTPFQHKQAKPSIQLSYFEPDKTFAVFTYLQCAKTMRTFRHPKINQVVDFT
jgi:hypothetical protein